MTYGRLDSKTFFHIQKTDYVLILDTVFIDKAKRQQENLFEQNSKNHRKTMLF